MATTRWGDCLKIWPPPSCVQLTCPMLNSSPWSSLEYLSSYNKSLAKSNTEVLMPPALRKSALYPNVSILAKRISGSRGRNVRGQNNSGFVFLLQVFLLAPPRPWTNTMSALRPPSSGLWTTVRPSRPLTASASLDFRVWKISCDSWGDRGVQGLIEAAVSAPMMVVLLEGPEPSSSVAASPCEAWEARRLSLPFLLNIEYFGSWMQW